MAQIVTFGEIMGRLATPGFRLFRQGLPGTLDVTFAGAEANVAVSLSILGADARFVSALPKHAVADACVDTLHRYGVETKHIYRADEGRLGLYFLETGANQRPSRVFYDREGTALSLTPADKYDWPEIFAGANWLHISGITPALSSISAEVTRHAAEEAKRLGLKVSCDLNFRKKLWNWEKGTQPNDLAEKIMREILPHVDVLIGNEEDCKDVLSIRAGQTDVESGALDIDRYPDVAKEIVRQFPGLEYVAITLRESLSASHNNWGAMLFNPATENSHFAPTKKDVYSPYHIRNIVDRVGGGDSFAAGLIFALNTPSLDSPEKAIEFAVASSCLAHSIEGDFNLSSRSDVEKLMGGSGSGRVER